MRIDTRRRARRKKMAMKTAKYAVCIVISVQ